MSQPNNDKWDMRIEFMINGDVYNRLQEEANEQNQNYGDGFRHSPDTIARMLMFKGMREVENKEDLRKRIEILEKRLREVERTMSTNGAT